MKCMELDHTHKGQWHRAVVLDGNTNAGAEHWLEIEWWGDRPVGETWWFQQPHGPVARGDRVKVVDLGGARVASSSGWVIGPKPWPRPFEGR